MIQTATSITVFCEDPGLLALSISPAQRTLLKAIYGEPLSDEELSIWQKCTGRESHPAQPFQEATILAGARAGKDSRIAVPVLLYEALFGQHKVHKGERPVFPLVAQDTRATRIAFGYAKSYLTESPILRSEVAELRHNEIELRNGARIYCFPSTQTSLRGWSIPCGIMDEVAFFRLEGSADSDIEIQTSIRRGMLGFEATKLLKISTPYLRSGVLYDDFQRHYGKDTQDVLVWKASSALMNPSIQEERLAREKRLDPVRYSREYEAEFSTDLASAFDLEAIQAAVVPGRKELPPLPGTRYHCFVDPSGGGRDRFSVSIAHAEGQGDSTRCVIDLCRGWRSKNPSGIVQEVAQLAKQYACYKVVGDRYSGQWVRESFRAEGITYEPSPLTASDLYLESVAFLNSGRVELLDNAELLREFQNLERRPSQSGKDKICHPVNQHDDLSNAVAGVAYLCAPRASTVWVL